MDFMKLEAKLKTPREAILAKDMLPGEIGVISTWGGNNYRGTVVMRFGVHLISLGKDWEDSWSNWFEHCTGEAFNDCTVIRLQQGDLLEAK